MSEVADPSVATGLDPKLKAILDDAPAPTRNILYCAACSNPVTHEEARIEMRGSHAHAFTNPYGFQFQVGCFAEALGCSISGAPSHADTWFPGYFWRIAACGSCQAHLGWYFESAGARSFFGLVLPRLQAR
jgi:hypothetical protein